MKAAVLLTLTLVSVPMLAKDHSSEYQVGIFSAAGKLYDGSALLCGRYECETYNQKFDVHYLRTADGLYSIEAPNTMGGASVGAAIVVGSEPDNAPGQWFMDQLHEGDKVLFASSCPKKRNVCDFWLPDPNHPGKEFHTEGHFWPDKRQTNTQTLCGTGKLKPEVEAQVCLAAPAAPNPSSAQAAPATAAPSAAPAAPSPTPSPR
jgi:hypothetical protein